MSNQRTRNEPRQNREDLLLGIINRSQTVINGLEECGAWKLVVEDIEKQCKNLDDNWQFVDDEKKLREFRITKMAVLKIKNLIDDYRFDMERATRELKSLVDKKNNIQKDVDNEGEETGVEES